MTEETQQFETPVQNVQNDVHTGSTDDVKPGDNKKEKCRPMTKVVIRRLPPTMTQEQLLEQISPLPEYDYLYFVKADMSLGQFAFSRAYINFTDQQDIFMFRDKFDNYVFVDLKGVEYPAVVEFAPFQKLPKKRAGRKKDLKCGTIESDPYYINFLESLKNVEVDSSIVQSKSEYSYQPPENTVKKISTPLLEYLKFRKQEKQRLRDEKREEKRRRDLERRKTKDDPIISKVLRSVGFDKDFIKDDKENKEEKDKFALKDLKNRSKKDEKSRDREIKSIVKGYRERIDDRNKDKEIKQRRYDDKKIYGRRDEKEGIKEEKRIDFKDDREDFREFREKKFEEKRGKSYEKMRQEKKKFAEAKKQIVDLNADDVSSKQVREEYDIQEGENVVEDINESVCNEDDLQHIRDNETQHNISEDKIRTKNTCNIGDTDLENENLCETKKESKIVKRRNSLESGGEGGTGDGNCLRRHKSLDGGGHSNLQKNENEEKEKDKKDPRLERRIRNKDRPTMEIYRPGMGKFSKQRLEREKSNDERGSLSQSPTPNVGGSVNCKLGKTATEVRSMTFKRSVSRDVL